MHEFVASAIPVRTKVKTTGRRKPRNSRRSVSLLDVSAVDAKPDNSSQISESNETLASGFKDSGYVRSDVSSLYDDEPKEAKHLVEELKFKDVLICELQESNRGLRLRCADAENKIWRLRVKCEAHCGCCSKNDSGAVLTPPDSGPDENDTVCVDRLSGDVSRFKLYDSPTPQSRVSQSFSYKPSSSAKPLVRSSSTGTLAKPTNLKALQDAQSPPESSSFSKVQKWQTDLLVQKLSRPAAAQIPDCFSSPVFPKDVPVRVNRHLETTRPTLSTDGRFRGRDYCLPSRESTAEASSDSSFDEDDFHHGRISPIERPGTYLDKIVELADAQFPSTASDEYDSKSRVPHKQRHYIPSSTPVKDAKAECHRCNAKPSPYVIVVPTGCCCCSKASTACLSSHAQSSYCEGQAGRLRARSDTSLHSSETFCGMKTIPSHNGPQETRSCFPTELPTNDISLDLSGRLTVPFTQGSDPKDEYKRRIEEGMKKLASDARAEADSLSFKPWPVPDFSGMNPLVRCLAETSHLARQMAIGLSKVDNRVQRLTDTPDRLSSAV